MSNPAVPMVTSNTRPRSSTSTDSLASWGEVNDQIQRNIEISYLGRRLSKYFLFRICESLGSTRVERTLRPSHVWLFRLLTCQNFAVDTHFANTQGCRLLTGSQDHTIRVFRADDGVGVYTLHGHTGPISSLFIGHQILTLFLRK